MKIARELLAWFDRSGRKHLPWQRDRTPYRVWVSEIMLQQTQVATVIAYYERFVQRFPDVQALASAPIDEVLHLWTGLGYYARARNLHRAAQTIVAGLNGEFPSTLEAMQSLPGVGRSTAGAILALARSQRHPILDGNVKRVLTRYFGIDGFPGEPKIERELWRLADECTPAERVADYTQAIMDLGATVCVRSRPLCAVCPLQERCVARIEHRQSSLPTPRPKKVRPQRVAYAVVAVDERGAVLKQARGYVSPSALASALDAGCGPRPTVVIVSACHSGVFLSPSMQRPNRIVLAAAAADRVSFGCGAGDRFTYYDQCLLQSFDGAATWRQLAASTRACVERLERTMGVPRGSQPQSWIGPAVSELRLPGR